MKKIAKLSLVAAVAVAGLTSANATALEESIKNVDFSGTMVYRYDDRDADGGDINNDSYKIVGNVKSKVNDDISANVSFVVGDGQHAYDMAVLGASANNASTTANQDGAASVTVSKANFAYTGLANTTIIAGKQGLGTPFTVASDAAGNEQVGTGLLALTTVGPVTFAGAYFNNHNTNSSGDAKTLTNGSENVLVAAAMGNIAGISLDAWYTDVEDKFSVYTLGAKTSFDISAAKLTTAARYSSLELDNSSADNTLAKIDLGLKAGIFGANIGYGFTNDEGGTVALDNDAEASYQGWGLVLNGKADASLIKLNVNADVLPSLNLAANYNILDQGKDSASSNKTDKEYYGQATYKMSKNFMTYVRFGQVEKEDAKKGTRGRLHVQYTF